MQRRWLGGTVVRTGVKALTAALPALALAAGAGRAGTGDVNGDGKVTRADAVLALRYAGGLANPTFAQYAAANTVSNGSVRITDAVRIARIAAGRDPAAPTGSRPATLTLTVNGATTRNIALPGGYTVAGRVLDRLNRVFAGAVSFRDTGSGETFGPFLLDTAGFYAAVLPPGTYQAIGLTYLEEPFGAGETTLTDIALGMGNPFPVAGNITSRNFARPDLPARYNATLSFSGPSAPTLISAGITFTETGDAPPSYGLDWVNTEVAFTPANRPIPPGTYNLSSFSQVGLSSGFFEHFYLDFATPIVMDRNRSRTLVYPTTYELDGEFTGPSEGNVVDVFMRQVPQEGKDVAAARVQAPGNTYLLAMPAGAATISVGLTTPFEETLGEWIIPYTMPSRRATRDIALPALPAFRTVTGRVLGPAGLPRVGAEVRADTVAPSPIPSAGVFAFHASTVTDASGNYTLRLPDGTYDVSVLP